MNRDTPLAEAHAIAKSQLDNEIQQKAQAEAAVKTARGRGGHGQAEPRLHPGPVADHGRGRSSHHPGRKSRQHAIGAYFGFAARSHQGLLLHQRQRISRIVQRAGGGGSDLLHGASKIPLTLTLSNGEVYPHKGHIAFVDRQLNRANRRHPHRRIISQSRQCSAARPVRQGERRDRDSP